MKTPPIDAMNPIEEVAVETVESQFFPIVCSLKARDGTRIDFTLSISRATRLRSLLKVALKEAGRLGKLARR